MNTYIGKCANKHTVRVRQDVDTYWIYTSCECGDRLVQASRLYATYSDKKCGGSCRNASKDECICNCAGENHGTGKVFVA